MMLVARSSGGGWSRPAILAAVGASMVVVIAAGPFPALVPVPHAVVVVVAATGDVGCDSPSFLSSVRLWRPGGRPMLVRELSPPWLRSTRRLL